MVDAADFVFWPACVRLRPFREHVEAAVAGGFTSMVVSTDTIDEAIQSGLSLAEMKRIADQVGRRVVEKEVDADVRIAHVKLYQPLHPEEFEQGGHRSDANRAGRRLSTCVECRSISKSWSSADALRSNSAWPSELGASLRVERCSRRAPTCPSS